MSETGLRVTGGLAGILGPVSLTIYFVAPTLTGWPFSGASGARLVAYANSHQQLFYAGAWFQATGALLSIVFFLTVLQLAGATSRLPGLLTILALAALLSVVLLESAFLVAVPMAAASGDVGTVRTTFALSNGVFVRVFPLAPASASFIGLGVVILGSTVLNRWFGYFAAGLGAAFELVGVAAIFSGVGLILAIVLSIVQEFWIFAAAIALLLSARTDSSLSRA